MKERHLAAPVKLWAMMCATAGVSLAENVLLTCILALPAFLCMALEKRWRTCLFFGGFYLALVLLLYLIHFHGLHMVIFSEFYVLMLYSLMPVFLTAWDLIATPPGHLSAALSKIRAPAPLVMGLLVVFRFFPTMKTEIRGVHQSMKNRRLTEPLRMLRHPAATCEYVLVPLLLRCLLVADQLSVSAVSRGIQAPGIRGSYYEEKIKTADIIWLMVWTAGTVLFLMMGGMK